MSTWPETYPSITPFPSPPNGCGCHDCWAKNPPATAQRFAGIPFPVMHVCGDCGDKRCPRAGNHRTRCQQAKADTWADLSDRLGEIIKGMGR